MSAKQGFQFHFIGSIFTTIVLTITEIALFFI